MHSAAALPFTCGIDPVTHGSGGPYQSEHSVYSLVMGTEVDWRDVGAIVRERRIFEGWSQATVAARARTTQRLVSKVEHGECRRPSLAVLRILKALDIEPPKELLRLDEQVNLPSDPFAEELRKEWLPFRARRSEPVRLRLRLDEHPGRLPVYTPDLELCLHGPARIRLDESDTGFTLTVEFVQSPYGDITYKLHGSTFR